jgi:hypothetical protein
LFRHGPVSELAEDGEAVVFVLVDFDEHDDPGGEDG